MALRHVVLLRWNDDATTEQRQAIVDALNALPEQIPHLREYVAGGDAAIAEGNYDLAVTGVFDDAASFQAYIDHPAHQKVVVEMIRPILAARAAVQFEL